MDIEMVDLLRKMVDEAPFGMYVLDGERNILPATAGKKW